MGMDNNERKQNEWLNQKAGAGFVAVHAQKMEMATPKPNKLMATPDNDPLKAAAGEIIKNAKAVKENAGEKVQMATISAMTRDLASQRFGLDPDRPEITIDVPQAIKNMHPGARNYFETQVGSVMKVVDTMIMKAPSLGAMLLVDHVAKSDQVPDLMVGAIYMHVKQQAPNSPKHAQATKAIEQMWDRDGATSKKQFKI